ncbi:uncharacterized protein LOC131343021 isoform X2 [Hemibagrus wyckioides]|uniref:uncharacterized protein LOC131343021 isoform X2 n=1 Tax=Hemibagrus wyckioides TaxID=337641 RepID=UPI00266C662B|nr:uncharacterized protein LOC131343021 isoform X2 [Hemibagrus wyckioides]
MSSKNLCEMDDSKKSEPKCPSSQQHALQKLFSETSEVKQSRHLCGDLIIKDKANTHYQAGIKAVDQLEFERAVICFTKAITLQTEQTQLYVARAEAYLQLCDFKSAALDYKHACNLEPQKKAHFHRLAFVYYLQGQCYCDRGMFLEALQSFAKAVELKPDFRPYHMRSLACLTALGRYSDAMRLVTNWLESETPSADLFTLRARLHHQLRQPMLCYYDLKSALKLNPSCPEARALLEMMEQGAERARQQAVTKAVEGELSDALAKITTALELNPENAQHYLFRVQYDVSPPFAAITASTLLGRLSTRFRSVFMGIFDHSSRSTFVRSHTDFGREGLALSLRSNSSQRCSIGLRSGLCAGQSSSSTPDSVIHVFMDLALCTGAQSCWKRKGPAPNCSHNVGSMELSKMSWYAEAFRVPFTGTKGPSPAPEKQPHTIIPPPPNFTLGTMQSDKNRSPGNRQTQTRPSDCQMEKRDSSLQRTRLHCSRVQWRRALHHCIRRFALHLVMYGLDAAARPWKPIP